jgi:hypothetical protein
MMSSAEAFSHSVPGDQLVAVVHVGLVVDVVVELERFPAHALGAERVVRVGRSGSEKAMARLLSMSAVLSRRGPGARA